MRPHGNVPPFALPSVMFVQPVIGFDLSLSKKYGTVLLTIVSTNDGMLRIVKERVGRGGAFANGIEFTPKIVRLASRLKKSGHIGEKYLVSLVTEKSNAEEIKRIAKRIAVTHRPVFRQPLVVKIEGGAITNMAEILDSAIALDNIEEDGDKEIMSAEVLVWRRSGRKRATKTSKRTKPVGIVL